MNADGTGVTQLTHNDTVQEGAGSFSPDGQKIVYVREDGSDSELWIMNVNGTNQTRITNNSIDDTSPEYSPNGSRFVYTAGPVDRTARFPEIYTINVDGTNRVWVTSNSLIELGPEYSPSGTKIVYEAGSPTTDYEIYTINPNGTSRLALTNTKTQDGAPTYSPDGKRIAYQNGEGGNARIMKIPSGGGTPRQVTTLVDTSFHMSWGPQ